MGTGYSTVCENKLQLPLILVWKCHFVSPKKVSNCTDKLLKVCVGTCVCTKQAWCVCA